MIHYPKAQAQILVSLTLIYYRFIQVLQYKRITSQMQKKILEFRGFFFTIYHPKGSGRERGSSERCFRKERTKSNTKIEKVIKWVKIFILGLSKNPKIGLISAESINLNKTKPITSENMKFNQFSFNTFFKRKESINPITYVQK